MSTAISKMASSVLAFNSWFAESLFDAVVKEINSASEDEEFGSSVSAHVSYPELWTEPARAGDTLTEHVPWHDTKLEKMQNFVKSNQKLLKK